MKTFFLLTAALLLAARLEAQTLNFDWFTLDGGGGVSSSGALTFSGTAGQPDAGSSSAGALTMQGGFWPVFNIVPTTPPVLKIVAAGVGQATISWTPATPGFVLQESASLAPASWSSSASAAQNPVTVSASSTTKFYRLIHP